MSLHPGFNIVTEQIADTESELAALEFFRLVAADEHIESPVTVTGLDDLLYNAATDSRTTIIRSLRQILRQTRSLQSMDAVQFVLDGSIVDDNAVRIRIERSGEGIYLDVGQLFVEEPRAVSATHAVARK
jgi:hypothetical protein